MLGRLEDAVWMGRKLRGICGVCGVGVVVVVVGGGDEFGSVHRPHLRRVLVGGDGMLGRELE